jgi:hypothetical protein
MSDRSPSKTLLLGFVAWFRCSVSLTTTEAVDIMRNHAAGRKPLCRTLMSSSPTIVTVSRALEGSGLVPFEARILLAHLLGCERAWVIGHSGDALTQEQARAFEALARRRRNGEPVAYLTGRREFFANRQ